MTHSTEPSRAQAPQLRPQQLDLDHARNPPRLCWVACASLALICAACAPGEVDAAPSEPGAMLTREELAAEAATSPNAEQADGNELASADVAPAGGTALAGDAETAPPPCETPLESAPAKPQAVVAPAPQPERLAAESTAAPAPVALAQADAGEIDVAKELALRPEGLEAWLAARPQALTGARRDLALGLAAGVRGDKQKALAMLSVVDGASQVRNAESTALRRLTEGPGALAVPASAADGEPALVLGAALGSLARRAQESARAGKAGEAAALWTEALELQLRAPWKLTLAEVDQWSRSIAEVQRRRRWNPEGGWSAREITVVAGDSLIVVRKRALELDPQLLVCTGQIARANGLKGERIHPGQKLKIPLDRAKLVVDLHANLVAYYLGDELVALWPCGVGAERSPTKAGRYTVGEKTREPMWFRPGAEPVPYGDPANPLGTRWIEWVDERGRSSGFGFHGTNEPDSIGGAASQGCIRMRDADVEELFEIAPKGAVVEVRA